VRRGAAVVECVRHGLKEITAVEPGEAGTAQDHGAGKKDQERRNNAQRSANVERGQVDAAGLLPFRSQQPGNQKAGDDEEDTDTQVPEIADAVYGFKRQEVTRAGEMSEQDEHNRAGAEAVQGRKST